MKIPAENANPAQRTLTRFPTTRRVPRSRIKTAKSHGFTESRTAAITTAPNVSCSRSRSRSSADVACVATAWASASSTAAVPSALASESGARRGRNTCPPTTARSPTKNPGASPCAPYRRFSLSKVEAASPVDISKRRIPREGNCSLHRITNASISMQSGHPSARVKSTASVAMGGSLVRGEGAPAASARRISSSKVSSWPIPDRVTGSGPRP